MSLGRLITETFIRVDEAESLKGDGSGDSLRGIAAVQTSVLVLTVIRPVLAAQDNVYFLSFT